MNRLACMMVCIGSAYAQQFAISTVAGGTAPRTLGPALSVAIERPQAVAMDTTGNVYFISSYSVLKVDPSGTLTRTAGNGTWGYSGDGGTALAAQLDAPTALAVDRAGNLYIAEAGGRVRKVTTDGIIATIAGNGVCHGGCYTGGVGDGGPATGVQLFYPYQLAVDPAGNLYIGEWNTPRIRRVSPDGIVATVVGNGMSGYSGDGGPAISAEIGAPWGLAFDDAGNLYFSDAIPGDDIEPSATHIRKVSTDGTISTIAGTGAVSYAGDGGPAAQAQFLEPGPLAVDSAGNVYVADTARIRRISTDGTITAFAGDGTSGYAGDGGPAANAELSASIYGQGLSMVADTAGNLYVADMGNNRVRRISTAGIITTAAGNGGGCCYSGDGGPAANAQLNHPAGAVVDGQGNVYVADTFNDRVRRISPDGVITTAAGNGTRGDPGDGGPASAAHLAWPTGLVIDASGNLFIADAANQRVRKVSPGGTISTVAGNGIAGYSGDGGAATSAQLSWPKDVALDGLGNLYIADTANHAVRKVSSDGIIRTVTTNLAEPTGIAVDAAGNIYAADTSARRVARIAPDGSITTAAGSSAQLVYPVGVRLDAAGNLYIADGASVRRLAPDGTLTTVAGTGVLGYSGDGGPAASAQIDAWGLAFDGSGNLYVAGPWNNALRLLRAVTQ